MIIRLLIAIALLYLLYRLVKSWRRIGGPSASRKAEPSPPARGEDLVEDPHCHVYVPVSHARRAEIDGKTVFFCSEKCLVQYKMEQKQR